MRLSRCIGRLPVSQYLCLSDIITANRQQTANGVLRQLIPEGPDTVLATRGIIIVGVCQVKTDILNADDHPSPRIGWMTVGRFIDGKGINHQSRRIHQGTGTTIRLNTAHGTFCRQRLHVLQWDTRNHYILPLGILLTPILPKDLFCLPLLYSDKSRDTARPLNTARRWQTTVLYHRLPHIARQFPMAGMLAIRHQHQSHKNQ